jgi:hypothetical protein
MTKTTWVLTVKDGKQPKHVAGYFDWGHTTVTIEDNQVILASDLDETVIKEALANLKRDGHITEVKKRHK